MQEIFSRFWIFNSSDLLYKISAACFSVILVGYKDLHQSAELCGFCYSLWVHEVQSAVDEFLIALYSTCVAKKKCCVPNV